MSDLTVAEIVNIIVGECSNGCTDEHSTYEYFQNHYKDRVDMAFMRSFVRAFNYAAIRENQSTIYSRFPSA